jgi:hypothetical protein
VAVYCDEDAFISGDLQSWRDQAHTAPKLKPAFDYDLLLQTPYVGSFVAFDRTHWSALEQEVECEFAAERMALLLAQAGGDVVHVSEVLYTSSTSKTSDGSSWAGLVGACLSDHAEVERHRDVLGSTLEEACRVRWRRSSNTSALIIVPTRARIDLLEPCVDSVLACLSANVTGARGRNYTFNEQVSFTKAHIYQPDAAEIVAVNNQHQYGRVDPNYSYKLYFSCTTSACTDQYRGSGNLRPNDLDKYINNDYSRLVPSNQIHYTLTDPLGIHSTTIVNNPTLSSNNTKSWRVGDDFGIKINVDASDNNNANKSWLVSLLKNVMSIKDTPAILTITEQPGQQQIDSGGTTNQNESAKFATLTVSPLKVDLTNTTLSGADQTSLADSGGLDYVEFDPKLEKSGKSLDRLPVQVLDGGLKF